MYVHACLPGRHNQGPLVNKHFIHMHKLTVNLICRIQSFEIDKERDKERSFVIFFLTLGFALKRMSNAGAHLVDTEHVIFSCITQSDWSI